MGIACPPLLQSRALIQQEEPFSARSYRSRFEPCRQLEFKGERTEHVRDWMAHRIANLKDLSEAGKAKIAAIRKEYAPKVHEAGNSLRAASRDEVHKIHAALSE
jgi:hypothetical protein